MSAPKRKLEDAEEPQEAKKQKLAHPVKVLVCGDVRGNFHKLFTMVQSVNASKAGPFNLLFCVGDFFCSDRKTEAFEEETENTTGAIDYHGAADFESYQYLTKKKSIPIATFFVDASSGTEWVDKMPNGGEIVPNLTFLGSSGLIELLGLQICFLSGVFDEFVYQTASVTSTTYYRSEDVKELEKKLANKQGQIDILLTSEWARGIMTFVRKDQQPTKNDPDWKKVGSEPVTRLLKLCAPRYHFCGIQNTYFERVPYKTVLADGTFAVTRFLALAHVSDNNTKQEKFLYAAGVTSVQDMTLEQRQKVPQVITDSPVDIDLSKVAVPQQQRKRRQRGPPPKILTPADCWFCLSCPKLERHLIVSIGEEAYLALPKGGLVEDHILIVGVQHVGSTMHLTDSGVVEFEKYKEALRSMFASLDMNIIVFERCIFYKSNVQEHLHLQIVPVPKEVSVTYLKEIFTTEAKQRSIEIQEFNPESTFVDSIYDAGCENTQYYCVELPDKSKLVGTVTDIKKANTYGRACCAQALGMPEREDWRKCAVPKEMEETLTKKFRQAFAKFDPSS